MLSQVIGIHRSPLIHNRTDLVKAVVSFNDRRGKIRDKTQNSSCLLYQTNDSQEKPRDTGFR